VLGSGMFIPGFEEQLVGKAIGEPALVQVTFPEVYHSEALAGKAAEFRCVIHQIRVKTAYQLDDIFAKEVGGCETLEEMRAKMQESLQAYADERGEMDLQDRLLRQAAATLDYTPTAEEMEYALDQQMETLKAQLARQGLSIEMYCSFLGTDEAKLREEARAAAEAMLRSQAAIDRIVMLEGLEAEPDEIAEALAVICRQNDMTMEQLKPYYDAEFEKAVVRSVLSTKATKLIRDAAVITETA
jgi:trigger factor